MPQGRIDPNAIQWTGPVAAKQSMDTRKGEATIGSAQASAASSTATAAKTRALTGPQVRKENALATKAEYDAQKAKMAVDKALKALEGRPAPDKLEAAQQELLYKIKLAVDTLQLSREQFGASGFGHGLTEKISGLPAATVAANIKTLGGGEAFKFLQEMRANSPTGGAVGNVSDKDIQLLINQAAQLDPNASDESFQGGVKELLRKLIDTAGKLGADPYEIATLLPQEDRAEFAPQLKSYRLLTGDVGKLSNYVDTSRKAGTFSPDDFAALMGEAYYNATGRKPDEAYLKSAYDTGFKLSQDPQASLSDFDYAQADKELQSRVLDPELAQKREEQGWGSVAGGAALNLVPSAFNMAYDIVKGFTVDLPDTIEGVAKVVGGATGLSDDPAAYEALKKYYSDRYGSMDGFKRALSSDPSSILADVAGVFSGGATLGAKGASIASKVGKIGALANAARAAEGFATIAGKLDPLALAGKTAVAGANLAGKTAEALGVNMPARMAGVTGAEVKQAFGAGKRGSQEFVDQLEGRGDVLDPLAKAQDAVTELYKARSADYTRRMARMNKTEKLDWADVDQALQDAEAVGKHKGIDISSAADVWQEIYDIADQFRAQKLDTIEDFDAMKRAISTIASKYPIGTPQNKVARDVAKTINNVITSKAPVYANIMRDYRTASDTLADVKSSLSLDAKSADTALNKLQRTLAGKTPRGGTVLDLLEQTKSGRGIGDIIAGQALSGREATGLAPTMATTASLASGSPELLATALATPQALGRRAYGLGQKYGAAERGVTQLRGLPPVQRAEQLAAKYGPGAYSALRTANPILQAQLDPFTPAAPAATEQDLRTILSRYSVAPPQAKMGRRGQLSLEQFGAPAGRPRVSLGQLNLPEDAEVAPEDLPPEEEQGYARGGIVAAPVPFGAGGTFRR